jgi:hypothetical protein
MAKTQLTIEVGAKAKLDLRKLEREHQVGHSLTWAEFLLEATA